MSRLASVLLIDEGSSTEETARRINDAIAKLEGAGYRFQQAAPVSYPNRRFNAVRYLVVGRRPEPADQGPAPNSATVVSNLVREFINSPELRRIIDDRARNIIQAFADRLGVPAE